MKLELKSIKHTAWASEETHCYQANLYVDGKPVAVVSNDGHGGCDRDYDHPKFKGDSRDYRAVMKSIEEYFESLPPSPFSYEGADGVMVHDTLPQTLESWCCDQVNDFLTGRELKRKLKSNILFQKEGDDGVYGSKYYPTVTDGSWVNGRRILNDMPFADALEIWKAT
jgi:hypothetical protein